MEEQEIKASPGKIDMKKEIEKKRKLRNTKERWKKEISLDRISY